MDPDAQLRQLRQRLLHERCVFISLLLLCGLGFYFVALKHRVCAILVEGREEVYVSDEAAARSLLLELLKEKSPRPEDDKVGFVQEVDWRPVIRRGQRLSTPDEARALLAQKLDVDLPAAVVVVEGQRRLAMASKAAVEQVLDTLKARYAGQRGTLVEEARFKQAVEVREEYVPVKDLCPSVKEGVNILSGGPGQAATYEVQPGDRAVRIAKRHHLTLPQLRELNPGRNLNRLSVGDKLRVSSGGGTGGPPLLTVVTVEEKSFETTLPYPTQTIPDPTLPPGKRVVQRPGQPGKVRLLVRLTCENGQEVAREKVAEETLRPPVAEEVRVGPAR